MQTATSELVWVLESDGFYRSKGGRFELWYVHVERAWVAKDFDGRKRSEYGCLAEVKEWCERRAR